VVLSCDTMGGKNANGINARPKESKWTSSVVNRNLNPVFFGQQHCFRNVASAAELDHSSVGHNGGGGKVLTIEVFDKDFLTRDDFIGSATVPLESLLGSNGVVDVWVSLFDKPGSFRSASASNPPPSSSPRVQPSDVAQTLPDREERGQVRLVMQLFRVGGESDRSTDLPGGMSVTAGRPGAVPVLPEVPGPGHLDALRFPGLHLEEVGVLASLRRKLEQEGGVVRQRKKTLHGSRAVTSTSTTNNHGPSSSSSSSSASCGRVRRDSACSESSRSSRSVQPQQQQRPQQGQQQRCQQGEGVSGGASGGKFRLCATVLDADNFLSPGKAHDSTSASGFNDVYCVLMYGGRSIRTDPVPAEEGICSLQPGNQGESFVAEPYFPRLSQRQAKINVPWKWNPNQSVHAGTAHDDLTEGEEARIGGEFEVEIAGTGPLGIQIERNGVTGTFLVRSLL